MYYLNTSAAQFPGIAIRDLKDLSRELVKKPGTETSIRPRKRDMPAASQRRNARTIDIFRLARANRIYSFTVYLTKSHPLFLLMQL